jgi:hypothetical protein
VYSTSNSTSATWSKYYSYHCTCTRLVLTLYCSSSCLALTRQTRSTSSGLGVQVLPTFSENTLTSLTGRLILLHSDSMYHYHYPVYRHYTELCGTRNDTTVPVRQPQPALPDSLIGSRWGLFKSKFTSTVLTESGVLFPNFRKSLSVQVSEPRSRGPQVPALCYIGPLPALLNARVLRCSTKNRLREASVNMPSGNPAASHSVFDSLAVWQ